MKVLTCSVCFRSDDKSIVLSCCHSICRPCALEEVQKKKSIRKCGKGSPFVCPKCNRSTRTQSCSDLTLEVVQDIFEASIDSKHELPAEEHVYHVAEKGTVKKKEIQSTPKNDMSSSNEIKATKTTSQSVPVMEEHGKRDIDITASNNIVEVLNNSKAFPHLVLETRKSQQMKSKAAAVMELFASQKKLLLDRLNKMEEELLKTLEETVARRRQEFDIYSRSIDVLNKRLANVETSKMHYGKNIAETTDLQTNLQLLVVEYTQLSNLINSHTVEPVELQLVSEGEMTFRLTGLCQDQIVETKQKNCICEKLQTEGLSCNYSFEELRHQCCFGGSQEKSSNLYKNYTIEFSNAPKNKPYGFSFGNQPTKETSLPGHHLVSNGFGFGTQPKEDNSMFQPASNSAVFGNQSVQYSQPLGGNSFFGCQPAPIIQPATNPATFGSQTAQGTSLFGSKPSLGDSSFRCPTVRGDSLFRGQPPTNVPTFGSQQAQGLNLFGNQQPTNATAFGSQSSQGHSLFRSQPAAGVSVFEKQQPNVAATIWKSQAPTNVSIFASQPAQGIQPTTNAPPFGNKPAQGRSLFGQPTNTATFGRTSLGSLSGAKFRFGGQPTPGTSTFGSQPAQGALLRSKPECGVSLPGSQTPTNVSTVGGQASVGTFLIENQPTNQPPTNVATSESQPVQVNSMFGCQPEGGGFSFGSQPLTNVSTFESQPAQGMSLLGNRPSTNVPTSVNQPVQSSSLFGSQPLAGMSHFEKQKLSNSFTFGRSSFGSQSFGVRSQPAQNTSVSRYQAPETSTFESQTANTSMSLKLFGNQMQTNASKYVSQPGQSHSLFESQPAGGTSVFGNKQPEAVAFGRGSFSFGNQSAPSTSVFQLSKTSTFGSQLAPDSSVDEQQTLKPSSAFQPSQDTLIRNLPVKDGSLFGSQPPSAAATSKSQLVQGTCIFGSQTSSNVSIFGSQTAQGMSLFGNQPPTNASTFGSQSAKTRSLFGNQPAAGTSLFENQQLTDVSFQSQPAQDSTQIGNQPVRNSSLFGSQAPPAAATTSQNKLEQGTCVFGSQPISGGSLFGGQASSNIPEFRSQTAKGMSLFGNQTQSNASTFGSQQTQSHSLFESQPAADTCIFENQQPTGVSFGSQTVANAFGFGSQTTSSSSVYEHQLPETSSFGSQPAKNTSAAAVHPQGTSAFQPTSNSVFGNILRPATTTSGHHSACTTTSTSAFGGQPVPGTTPIGSQKSKTTSTLAFGSKPPTGISALGTQQATHTFGFGSRPDTNNVTLKSQPASVTIAGFAKTVEGKSSKQKVSTATGGFIIPEKVKDVCGEKENTFGFGFSKNVEDGNGVQKATPTFEGFEHDKEVDDESGEQKTGPTIGGVGFKFSKNVEDGSGVQNSNPTIGGGLKFSKNVEDESGEHKTNPTIGGGVKFAKKVEDELGKQKTNPTIGGFIFANKDKVGGDKPEANTAIEGFRFSRKKKDGNVHETVTTVAGFGSAGKVEDESSKQKDTSKWGTTCKSPFRVDYQETIGAGNLQDVIGNENIKPAIGLKDDSEKNKEFFIGKIDQ